MSLVTEKLRAAVFLFWLICTVMVLIEVSINNSQSANGQRFYDMTVLKEQLLIQNFILESQIASESSLLQIEKKAKEMGFVKVNNIQFITTY